MIIQAEVTGAVILTQKNETGAPTRTIVVDECGTRDARGDRIVLTLSTGDALKTYRVRIDDGELVIDRIA